MSVARRCATSSLMALTLAACAKSEGGKAATASPSSAATSTPAVSPPPSPLSAKLDSLMAESMADGKVPGMALSIVRNDSLIHSKGYGFANLEKKIAMTDTTPVIIGSTSKTFTSFAIMQLADSGRVALDSSAARYVALLGGPDAKTKSSVSKPVDPRFAHITVRHLLTNVSGIPSGFSGDAYDVVDTATDALEQIVRNDMLPRRLDFDPGKGYTYSNRGFSLASLVVQDASGLSYEDYIAKRIFEPLGMTHSTGRFWEGSARGMVQGYRESVDGKPLARPASVGRSWTGSGMILSSTRDVALFLQTLLDSGRAPNGNRVLSAAGAAEIMRAQQKAESELGGPTMYGLGWEVSEVGGTKLVMKAGSVGTMGSMFILIPEKRTGLALVFNTIDYGKVGLFQNIVKTLLGAPTTPYQPLPTPPNVAHASYKMPAARLASFVGLYETRNGWMRITARGDTLAGRMEGNDVTLEPSSDTSFIVRSVLREQEGSTLVIKPCSKTMCIWMKGDSSAVRR